MIATNETIPQLAPPMPVKAFRAEPLPVVAPRSVESHELRGGKADGALITRAIRTEELLRAYRFRHGMLAEQGLIEPGPRELQVTRYDAVPEMAVFLAKAGREVVAVQGAITDSEDLGLPAGGPFFIEIDGLRHRGRSVCEATQLAISTVFRRSELPGELIRCCVANAVAMGCNHLVTAVEPWQARQYERMGFERISPVRVLSSEAPFPALLMGLELDALDRPFAPPDEGGPVRAGSLRDYYLTHNPYERHVARWALLAGEAFHDSNFLSELLVSRTDLLSRCPHDDAGAVRRRWGDRVFEDRVAVASSATWP